MMHIRILSASLMLVSHLVWAQAAEDTSTPLTRERANAVRAQAEEIRSKAKHSYTTEQAACYEKFLVNSCLEDAKKKHTQALIDARKLEKPAREFLHAEDKRDSDAKEAQRQADLVSRQTSQKAQAETYRQDEAAKAIERENKLAAKERQAAAGRKKTAAEQAKRAEKLAKREKKDAERAAKNAAKVQKQAERDAKKVAKPEAVPAD